MLAQRVSIACLRRVLEHFDAFRQSPLFLHVLYVYILGLTCSGLLAACFQTDHLMCPAPANVSEHLSQESDLQLAEA